jgi:hypothetical protein
MLLPGRTKPVSRHQICVHRVPIHGRDQLLSVPTAGSANFRYAHWQRLVAGGLEWPGRGPRPYHPASRGVHAGQQDSQIDPQLFTHKISKSRNNTLRSPGTGQALANTDRAWSKYGFRTTAGWLTQVRSVTFDYQTSGGQGSASGRNKQGHFGCS